MKGISLVKRIGVVIVALILSFTMFATNSTVYAATNTATVTHVKVDGNGNELVEKERFSYPVGDDYKSHMKHFDGYRISGISSSSISIGGTERVTAKVEWLRVETKEEQETERIPYETIEKEDPTLDKGEKVVEQEGVAGEKTITYEVTYIGGVERGRSKLYEEVNSEPTKEIVRIGTKVTEVKEEQETEEIAYETIEKEDPTLDKGETVVDQAGEAGEKTITYEVTYVNGEEVSREVASEEVTVDPVDKIILVGTKVTEVKEERETEEAPYETIEKEDPTLNKGETVVDRAGETGEKTVTYEVTYINGEEVSREVVSEEVTVDPVDEIILVGTKVTEVKEDQQTEEIPYETIEKEDPTIDKGETVVDQAGETGEKTITYEVSYVNGEEVSREVVSEEVTVDPVDEIILIGTKVTEVKEEQETEKVPYATIEKEDSNVDYGETVVDQAGETGEKTVTYEVTYVNGEEVSREAVLEEVTVDPVDEIVLIGTKGLEVKEEQETEEVPYETVEKEDPTLEKGKTVVDQAGEAGEKTTTYEVGYVNGEEVERETVGEEITVDPKNEVIRIGTKVTEGTGEDTETGNGDSEGTEEDAETGDADSEENDNSNGAVADSGNDKGDGNSSNVEEDSSDSEENNQLPKTATSIFNWLVGGFIILVLGGAGIFTTRRRTV